MGDTNQVTNSNDPIKLITLDNLGTYHTLMDEKKEEKAITLTWDEYQDLPQSEKMNGKTYYITDSGGSAGIIEAKDVMVNSTQAGLSSDTVQAALKELNDKDFSGSYNDLTNKPILGTASALDVATSGDATNSQVVKGDDSRLTDSRNAADVPAWAKASTKPTYTASEVGLGNVGNFKAVSTVANQELTSTEQSNARANIGAGTSSFSGNYNDLTNKPTIPTLPTNIVNGVAIGSTNGTVSVTTNGVTADVAVKGLGNAAYTNSSAYISSALKGANNGVAELDSNGLVPSSQLPSYVDDVLEYSSKSAFPITGETGKIYVDTTTNLTYRWSGSDYIEISPSLALGTTSSTAYRGDYGNTAYSHATDSGRLTTATASGLYKIASTTQGHIASLTAIQKSDITGLGIPAQDTTYSNATTSAAGLMSSDDKTKLNGIATGAEVNVQSDWNQTTTTADDYIKNKPTLGTASSKDVATSGNASSSQVVMGSDTRLTDSRNAADVYAWAKASSKPTYTASEVGLGNVGNFKAVSTVASQGLSDAEKANARANIGAGTSSFSGSYNDLSNKPTIPTVNNATLTIQKNGTNVQTFTANQGTNVTANITVPTKVSDLTNDSGYTTNTGTVTSVTAGAGLTGGTITGSGTIKADLKSETKSTLEAASMGSTASRQYAVGLDKNGDLSVNVPWANTTYSNATSSSSGLMSSNNFTKLSEIQDKANRVTKTMYTLNYNSWTYDSYTGFYKYAIQLNPKLSNIFPPNVYLTSYSGSDIFIDDDEIEAFNQFICGAYLDTPSVYDQSANTTLYLYATMPPQTISGTPKNLKIYVEGIVWDESNS